MAAHTPGPWRYEEGTKTIRSEPTNYWLATMDSWDGAVNNKANGTLIAAAPDLRRFAQEIAEVDLSAMSDSELWDWIHERKSRSRALVAKADGAQ